VAGRTGGGAFGALLFACLGVLAGILLTYGTQWAIAHLVPSSLNQETVYAWWPLSAAIAIAGALLGAIVPITKAVRQDVTDALAYE
jgi:putative ABC transport system permease protein